MKMKILKFEVLDDSMVSIEEQGSRTSRIIELAEEINSIPITENEGEDILERRANLMREILKMQLPVRKMEGYYMLGLYDADIAMVKESNERHDHCFLILEDNTYYHVKGSWDDVMKAVFGGEAKKDFVWLDLEGDDEEGELF
jgi:hypothetical protein